MTKPIGGTEIEMDDCMPSVKHLYPYWNGKE